MIERSVIRNKLELHDLVANYIEGINSQTIVTASLNIPGLHKHQSKQDIVLKFIKKILCEKYDLIYLNDINNTYGKYLIFECLEDPHTLKEKLIKEESKYPHRRILDLDCIHNKKQISRRSRKRKQRRCFLCENDSDICIREKNHSYRELAKRAESLLESFIKGEVLK